MMVKKSSILILISAVIVSGYLIYPVFSFKKMDHTKMTGGTFNYLSKNGNSTCSAEFKDSIMTMGTSDRIQGSCCSAMSMHRYQEQVSGLEKYKDIPEIPADPYNVEAGLAKRMVGYYDMQLTDKENEAYNYAMENSNEKGPCCCKCWRWYVYGGLGKYLIREYKFSGEQLTEVWNFSDGCGGDEDHNGHG